MRALTIKAPWAWAIAHAGKRIENRTWTTRYRGPIYIHAGASDLRRDRAQIERITGRPVPDIIEHSALIAVAQLVDIVPLDELSPDPWACGPYCWVLDGVQPIAPRPMAGKLGLWRVADAPYLARPA